MASEPIAVFFIRATLSGMVGNNKALRLLGALFILCVQLVRGQSDVEAPVKWEICIEGPGDSTPAVAADGTIVFGTLSGVVWAIDPVGRPRWRFRADSEVTSSPAVGLDGHVYFGSRDRHLYALGPTGKLLWKFRTGGWIDSSPALATDGSVYFGSWDGKFYALDSSGKKLWTYPTGRPIVSSPAIDTKGNVYFGSHDEHFYALTPEGKLLWKYDAEGPILSSPALSREGNVYFTSVAGWLFSLDTAGTLRWRVKTGSPRQSSPVLGPGDNVFVGVNRELWAVSDKGVKFWVSRDEDMIDASPLSLANETVCYVSRYGMVRAIYVDAQNDLHVKWHFYLAGHGSASLGIAADGTMYTFGKVLQFYSLATPSPLSASPWPTFRGNARNTGNLADSKY